MLTMQPQKLQEMIEDYVMDIKNKVSPNTVPTRIFPIQSFFEMNDVVINWKKIRRLFPAKVKKSGNKPWTTSAIQKMLEFAPDQRAKTLIHFLSSTGTRIGAIEELKLKHLAEMPMKCKSVLVYPESTYEYFTFLTPEASQALDNYLQQRRNDGELLTPESPVFRAKYRIGIEKVILLGERGMTAIIQRVIKNANLRPPKVGERYDIQTDHGFRKRFNTILKLNNNINPNLVEKMMGHKRGLDGSYLVPTKEELFEEFKKGILDLTIDSSERLKHRNQELEGAKLRLEKEGNQRMNKLESKINTLERLLEQAKTS